MSTLVIEGGHRLYGRLDVEGNKNSALPLIAACLLTEEECTLHNVPRIADVEVMCRLLLDVGAEVEGIGTTSLKISALHITKHEPDRALVGRLRGSVLLMGPLLARCGKAIIAPPGGDFPTRRTIKTHLEALQFMGARLLDGPGHQLDAPDGLRGASFYLDEASVTGTETALLAAVAAPGRTEIRHAAQEPHVVELCEFLRGMGASIEGLGGPTLTVEAPAKLRGTTKTLWGDYIEAGSWGVVAAMTAGGMEIGGTRWEDMEVVSSVLRKMNVQCEHDGAIFRVEPRTLIGAGRITTGLWPGFPSDLVSLVTALATQAAGATLVHDWLYELRLFALEQMSGMGADLFLCDPHRIIVTGPRLLRGKQLDTRDIRSGMALIAAALAAHGQSRVAPLETVERGYGRLVERLQGMGAQVARVE
jgi:UDP-N-acetylglucosamine 1-carboxyvinyltransferase